MPGINLRALLLMYSTSIMKNLQSKTALVVSFFMSLLFTIGFSISSNHLSIEYTEVSTLMIILAGLAVVGLTVLLSHLLLPTFDKEKHGIMRKIIPVGIFVVIGLFANSFFHVLQNATGVIFIVFHERLVTSIISLVSLTTVFYFLSILCKKIFGEKVFDRVME